MHRRARALWRGDGPASALACALVLGDASRLDPSVVQGLRRIGLGHVLAVSGLHAGLVVLGILVVCSGLPRPLRLLLAAGGALGLLALVGPRPSIARATLMAIVALGALAAARPPQARNALAAAVIVMTLSAPTLVSDLGFRLSVAATASLLVLAPRLAAALGFLPRLLRLPLAASWSAQLATAPLALPVFAWRAPLALLANLVAIPYLALVLGLLAASTAIGLVIGTLPVPLAWLDAVARPWLALGRLPSGAWTGWPAAWSPLAAAGASSLVAVLLLADRRWRRLAAAACLMLIPHAAPVHDPVLQLLDVGQGDAMVIRDGRSAVLVDGGGWPRGDIAGRVLIPALAAAGVRRIDGVVLSHADRDHCGGLVDLAGYLRIPVLWASAGAAERPCGAALVRRSRRFVALAAGDRLQVGRWQLEVLAAGGEAGGSANDASVVLRARVRGRTFLLAGDLEARGEQRLVHALAGGLAADVLKVAHHGSKSSSSPQFLRAVGARIALISAGRRNPYGHPAPAALARLRAAETLVLRTDRDGGLRLVVRPGGRLEVSLAAGRIAAQ